MENTFKDYVESTQIQMEMTINTKGDIIELYFIYEKEDIFKDFLSDLPIPNKPYLQITHRPNNNDCWNMALMFALKESYQSVRNRHKHHMSLGGGLMGMYSKTDLLKNGYELIKDWNNKSEYKTLRSIANNAPKKYEYVASVRGHIVYIKNGQIYDNFDSSLRRVKLIYRRLIQK